MNRFSDITVDLAGLNGSPPKMYLTRGNLFAILKVDDGHRNSAGRVADS